MILMYNNYLGEEQMSLDFLKKDYVGRYWSKMDDGRILCALCPRLCKLAEGQRGFCFVRQNKQDQLILTTYGRSSGFSIDPIEKKPLNHFYPGTSVLSFGTAGCNLGCKFCQNWNISKSKEFDSLSDKAAPETIARAAKAMHCKSVAFTYNDPVIFAEYAIDIAKACRKAGVKTVAVTAGYISEKPRVEFYEHMDATNIDLKGFTKNFYEKITLSHLQDVLDTLIYVKHKTDVWLEITNLIIPNENDSDKEIEEMTQWISANLGNDVPMHFSAFHPDFKMLNHPNTPHATLTRAREIALKNGLRYVYVGNVHDTGGSSTYCHKCGELLIERDWYELGAYGMKNSSECGKCSEVCAGVFDERPGNWGAKRQAVRLSDYK